MTFLNYLFRIKKGITKELRFDAEKRLQLWAQHLADYPKREALAKHFSFGNVDKALEDLDALDEVLNQIETLISEEFVHIKDEKKTDEEILADLKQLSSVESGAHTEELTTTIVDEHNKQKALLKLFRKIYDVSQLELHAIQRIRQRPENIRELLLHLFDLIFHREEKLYETLKSEYFKDRELYMHIQKILRAFLLEEEYKEAVQTAEAKFVRSMVKIMGKEDSKHHYRQLAENIYFDLAEKAGAPLPRGEDLTKVIERLGKLMTDDTLLFDIIKQERPQYSDEKIRWIMKAFRKSYELGHFEGLASEFAT